LPLTVATTSAEGERWHPAATTKRDEPSRIGTTERWNMRFNLIACNLVTPMGFIRTPAIKDKSTARLSDRKLIT
jgi:hypothetical protein